MAANNRSRDLDARIGDMERRANDLKLIRLFEIHDERDDRVSALEASMAALEEWQPWVEALIDDTRFDLCWAAYFWYRVNKDPSATHKSPCASSELVAGDVHAGETAD